MWDPATYSQFSFERERPFAELHGEERAKFVREYAALLRAAYPRRSSGTVLPFRRIFAAAQLAGGES